MSDHIDVYCRNFSEYPEDVSFLKSHLSEAEIARANRFVVARDARAYVISHSVLRQVLASYVSCDPAAICFGTTEYGKPTLIHPECNLHFNLSHSGDYVLIGVSRDQAIGVDLEQHRDQIDLLTIAQRYFTHLEFTYIAGCSEAKRAQAFYAVWTAKEAYVKALGRGLGYGLDQFSVINAQGELVNTIDDWVFYSVSMTDAYSAMIVGPKGKMLRPRLIN